MIIFHLAKLHSTGQGHSGPRYQFSQKIKFPFLTNKLQKSNLQTIPYINPKKYDSIRSTTHFIPTQSCQLQNDIIFFQLINDIKLKYSESNTFIIKIYKLCVSFMMFNSVLKQKLAKKLHYFFIFSIKTLNNSKSAICLILNPILFEKYRPRPFRIYQHFSETSSTFLYFNQFL